MDEVNAALKAEGSAQVYELPQLPAPVVITVIAVGAAVVGPEVSLGAAVVRFAFAFAK
jgi:hypothetical protein